jgi:3-hydroxybutyrate dehydrogenase
MSLAGERHVAIITGSTSGIGLGIARAFAGEGYAVMLNGLGDLGEIEKLHAAMAREFQVDVRYHGADLSRPDDCMSLVKETEAQLGRVDVLVNNAGIQHVAPLESLPADRWDAVLAVNLSSAFHTIRTVVPILRKRRWGRIINIASAHGLVASPFKSAYVAAKHGLVGLTKVVALETAGSGITCNAICPGWVLTPLVQKQIETRAAQEGITVDQATRELLAEKHPSGQFTTVDQIGSLAVFLSSAAADNLTGACLPVDGGWTAQ